MKKLGVFDLGIHRVNLCVDNTDIDGGWFDTVNNIYTITTGINAKKWEFIVNILMHEAIEMAFMDMGLRFRPSIDCAGDNGSYIFVMNHTQFSEANARAAEFVAAALPKLEKEWKRKHKIK